jgi:hypothetical protein
MRIAATLVLCLLGGPAMAAGCDRWTASMEEDEGGPRMMASICSGTGDNQSMILVQCGGDGQLNLRFMPGADVDYPPNAGSGDFQAELKFALDKDEFRHQGRYEDMDGAMALYIPIKDPLIEAMKTHKDITVADTDGKMSGITFTLKNSQPALHKVIDACGG